MRLMVLIACVLAELCATGAAEPAGESEMKSIQVLDLWEGDPPASVPGDDYRPVLECLPLDTGTPRGAVIVFPGGGYAGRADYEGRPVAERMNELGFHAFVVQYRVSPHRHPAPLLDAAQAVRIVRARAAEWNILPDKIAVLGFSAGGHLAGTVGLYHGEADAPGQAHGDVNARPDAMVLCYAVITGGTSGHRGSYVTLLGEGAPDAMHDKMSLDRHVDADTPPAFIWHTADDEVVPVDNALLMASALGRAGVPYELHVYPSGPHGMALGQTDLHVATWTALCGEWLRGMGW